jgi:hypothetical protein
MLYKFSFTHYIQFIFILLLGWLTFVTIKEDGVPFLINVDLIFHEAGHIFAFFFGDYVRVLGGTIGQLFVPLLFALYFFIQRNTYASAILFWWLGENFINVSVYVGDARARELPILGGDSAHDWAYLLGEINALKHDVILSKILWTIGIFIMVSSLMFASISIIRSVSKRQWEVKTKK